MLTGFGLGWASLPVDLGVAYGVLYGFLFPAAAGNVQKNIAVLTAFIWTFGFFLDLCTLLVQMR